MWLNFLLFILSCSFKHYLQIPETQSTTPTNLHPYSAYVQTRRAQGNSTSDAKHCCDSPAKYSAEEIQKIAHLRELTRDLPTARDEYMQRDHFIVRWLRARDLDVNAANLMMREAFQWRVDNQMDTILKEKNILPVPNIKQAYKFQGHDKEGRPVVLLTPTFINLRKLLLEGKRAAIIRFVDQILERGFHVLRNMKTKMTNGEEVLDFVVIFDVEGYSFKQHACLQCLVLYWEAIQHFEKYYPEALKYFIVINMKKSAVVVMEATRPFVRSSTERAIRIFGSHRPEWTEFLLSIISADQLPYRFGGTRPENDEHSYKFR